MVPPHRHDRLTPHIALPAPQLGWPLPATLSDRVLEAMLYAGPGTQQGSRLKVEPDWTHVHRELRRPGVTLMLLWEEYRQTDAGDQPGDRRQEPAKDQP